MTKVYILSKLALPYDDPRFWEPNRLISLGRLCDNYGWTVMGLESNKVYFRLGLCYKEVDLSKL